MAKSMRSKRKRKMRAIKRQTTAPKELKRLKKILGLIKDDTVQRYSFDDVRETLPKQEVNKASGGCFYTPKVIPGIETMEGAMWEVKAKRKALMEKIKEETNQANEDTTEENKTAVEATMDIDRDDLKVDPKTLQNAHGNYPVWMTHRQIKRINSAKSGGRKSKKNQRRYAW